MQVLRGFKTLSVTKRVLATLEQPSHRAIGGLWGSSTALLLHTLRLDSLHELLKLLLELDLVALHGLVVAGPDHCGVWERRRSARLCGWLRWLGRLRGAGGGRQRHSKGPGGGGARHKAHRESADGRKRAAGAATGRETERQAEREAGTAGRRTHGRPRC